MGCVLAYEFKEGNDNGDRKNVIEKALEFLPEGIKVNYFMADSEACTGEIMNFLNNQKVTWIIAADKNPAVQESIKHIHESQWQPFVDKDGIVRNIELTETIHILNTCTQPFRLIVSRTLQDDGTYFYHCIATNDTAKSSQKIAQKYRERSNAENDIKEVKNGFGMRKMPSGGFLANALYFGIGILTYNLFIAQKRLTMSEDLWSKTIKSIRWMLINLPGKVINHAGRLVLKLAVSEETLEAINEIRFQTYNLLKGGT